MLLSGRELRAVFQHFCPFDQEGNLLDEGSRVTILAANVNLPVEIQARAFAMAAAAGEQSPMIVQLSYNSAETIGNAAGRIRPLPGVRVHQTEAPVVVGARQAVALINSYAATYGAKYMAVALDHFQVPKYDESDLVTQSNADSLARQIAKVRVLHAAEYMRDLFGEEADLTEETLERYVSYLVSPEYIKFRRDFLAVVQAVRPAWGMIDTEKLPPILDFVVTREIVDGVRVVLGNTDMMIEAEFGATGQRGEAIPYERLTGERLQHFAEQVACFIQYTGADAIAYPIGMEHAALKDVKHEPDRERLLVVQRQLFLGCGRYIPFAQHGGTGAASVVRGLVGKNNVNTHFLVAGANALADHVEKHVGEIRAGDKKYAGTGIFTLMLQAEAEAALAKLAETGSRDTGPQLAEVLRKLPEHQPEHDDTLTDVDPYAE